jgi:hypothetical protein
MKVYTVSEHQIHALHLHSYNSESESQYIFSIQEKNEKIRNCCTPSINTTIDISDDSILTNFAGHEYREGKELELFGEEICAEEFAKSQTNNPNSFAECSAVLGKVRATVDFIRQLVSGDLNAPCLQICVLYTNSTLSLPIGIHTNNTQYEPCMYVWWCDGRHHQYHSTCIIKELSLSIHHFLTHSSSATSADVEASSATAQSAHLIQKPGCRKSV